ncbi:MAG: sigma-70 family RNA polymerase sigma factor [Sedimentisphaerales bacterium]|nr:sigma-70 family RNA polymerase sigma factor [Sedimentisphaerales bacterium]
MAAMAKESEELALVERFRRGDDSAFDGIVERHSAAIAALANRLLGWPQDVEDLVQDVFVAAFTGLRTFRGDCHLRTWLFTITINRCRSYRYRRILRLRRTPLEEAGPAPARGRNAEETAMAAETFGRVRRAVQALPAKYREVVVLRYLQELETNEICEMLGISPNVMQVRLNRARKRLREDLAQLIEGKA